MDKQQAAALKTLTKARKLIDRSWIKGRLALDKGSLAMFVAPHERPGAPISKAGTFKFDSFCALGAIEKADGPGELTAKDLLRKAINKLYYGGKNRYGESAIYKFNDRRVTTKDDVLAAFDAAIQMIDVDAEASNNDSK
jgi:hypothetical protein